MLPKEDSEEGDENPSLSAVDENEESEKTTDDKTPPDTVSIDSGTEISKENGGQADMSAEKKAEYNLKSK